MKIKNIAFDSIEAKKILFCRVPLFLILFFTLPLYARESNIKFDHITIEQGLSQSSIYSMCQDFRGFLWFGTEAGLNKYDGYNIRVYIPDANDPTSLSNNYIYAIFEDKKGVLWIGTDYGLNRYNREKDSFVYFFSNHREPNSLSSNHIYTIFEDSSGILWIGTDKGLNRFNRKNNTFIHYRHKPDDAASLSHDVVRCICEDNTGFLWIGTQQGLNRMDIKNESFTRYYSRPANAGSLSNDNILSIFKDREGFLWIGTQEGGLNQWAPGKKEFIHYKNIPNDPKSLSDNGVNAIYEDREGTLWIATYNGGVNRFNPVENTFTHLRYDPNDPTSIGGDRVQSIYEDKSGVLWFGTYGSGASKLNREATPFIHYKHNPQNPHSLPHKHVRSFYVDPDGMVWVGTDGGGLTKIHREKGLFTHYQHNPQDPFSLSNNDVFSICEDGEGVLWIGAFDGGLNKFDSRKGTSFRYQHRPGDETSLSDNRIRSICKDREGRLWIATDGGGLNRFNRDRETFTRYRNIPGNPNSLSYDRIFFILEDQGSDILWIATFGGGLDRFDPQKEQFIHFKADAKNPNTIPNDYVICIHQDKEGILWLGSNGGGLTRFDPNSKTFESFGIEDGLPDKAVYGILADSEGNLWMSSNQGISKFNPRTRTFKNYDDSVGLQSKEFNGNACYKSPNGEMFFGGINGFNSFYPEQIKDNTIKPQVVITGFKLFNQPVPITEKGRGILEKFITETKELELSYRDNVMSLEFAALHYVFPGKNQYAYKLEGFDKDWVYTGAAQRIASYTNLSPGDYLFRVKASNNSGLWNETGVSLKITIIPPFWQTWWFKGFIGLIILFLVVLVYQLRTRSIRERAGELVERVEERTAELKTANRELQLEIIERERVEKEIKELKEFNENIVQNMAEGIVVQDENLTMSFVNPAAENFLGFAPGELTGKPWDTIIPEDQKPIIFAADVKRRRGEASNYEVELLTKDSRRIPVLVSGTPIIKDSSFAGTIAVFTDISNLKLAEKEIEKRQKYLESLLHDAPDAIVTVDADNIINEWNQGAEQIFGYTRKEALGKNIDDLVTRPDLRDEAADLTDKVSTGEKLLSFETCRCRKDGTLANVIVSASPIRIDEELQGTVAVYTDITERKQAEEELKKAHEIAKKERQAAESANQAKSMFLAKMSHEIRTPMNAVIGFSEMLLHTHLDDEQTEYTRNIIKSGEALVELINEILDFSKIEAGQLTLQLLDFDPEVTAFDVCRLIQPRLGSKPVEILCRVSDRIPAFIRSDPGRFRQVLINLMGNAVKFTHEGEIELSLDAEEENPGQIKLHVIVRDTGIGIPADKLEHIFNIFQQVDDSTTRRYGGTGLGLSICRQIALLLKGDVWVESTEGKGSTFHFTAWVDKSHKTIELKPAIEALSGQRILVLDDNENNLKILSANLERFSLNPTTVSRGDRVLPVLEEALKEDNPFRIGILDIQMPGISGFQVAKKIRKHKNPRIAKLPLLAFASTVPNQNQMYRESGFDGFLPKPIQRQKLLNMIRRLLGEDEERDEELAKEAVITQYSLVEEAKHSIYILLVEDHPMNQKLATHMLTKAGYRVRLAKNGKEAVESYCAEPEKFTLILMDINMPQMDGLEATRRIRQQGYLDIPIIAMTANAMKEDRARCLQAGMNDYIVKPIKREVVFRMIEKWVLKSTN